MPTPFDSRLIYDWNEVSRTGALFSDKIELFDETLRDGIQSPSVTDPSIEDKLAIVDHMESLGITSADVGLPGAGQRAVDDVTAIAKHVRDNNMKLEVAAAGRTHVNDIEPIVRIRDDVGIPIVAYLFLGTSPIRQLAENWNLDRLMKTAETALDFAVKHSLDVSFVTEDTIRSKPETLKPLFEMALDKGVRRLTLCDTVGHATPDGIKNLIDWTRDLIAAKDIQGVKLEWHGHNDRGLGVPNAIFAAEYGCERIHGTCLGIGERVGNTALDQVILNLKLMGYYAHDTSSLVDYCELTSRACQVPLPDNYPLAGHDAFRTATGVHAAAVIKAEKSGEKDFADVIYSGVPAGWFGKKQRIEVGHMSGLSNVKYWLSSRGYALEEQLVSSIFDMAKSSNRVLSDDEITQFIEQRRISS